MDPSTRTEAHTDGIAALVLAGLSRAPKALPPVLFYDERGSALFEEICELEEYYPTRTEQRILEERAAEVVSACGPEVTVAEFGSGSSEKTTTLLDALLRAGREVVYVPMDVSEAALEAAARRIDRRFPALEVRPLAGDHDRTLGRLRRHVDGQCLGVFLGGSLGNLDPPDAIAFMARVRRALPAGSLFLLGLDLVKDRDVLERAYDDARGVTARFNRNVLRRINRELDGEFDEGSVAHRALWNARRKRVEMHLVSLVDQRVPVHRLGRTFAFAAGETIHTENSYKYTFEDIEHLARQGGWRVRARWTDDGRLFSLSLLG